MEQITIRKAQPDDAPAHLGDGQQVDTCLLDVAVRPPVPAASGQQGEGDEGQHYLQLEQGFFVVVPRGQQDGDGTYDGQQHDADGQRGSQQAQDVAHPPFGFPLVAFYEGGHPLFRRYVLCLQATVQCLPRFFQFLQFHIQSSLFIFLSFSLMRFSLVATLVTVSPVISLISS